MRDTPTFHAIVYGKSSGNPRLISELNQKIFERVEEWRNQPFDRVYPYIFVDGI